MLHRTLCAAALVVTTALPATANGVISLTVNAASTEEARVLHAGLMIYRIARGIDSGAFVHQDGSLNGAALSQVASGGSVGVIHQDGNGHSATLDQRGRGQSHGIFQFGAGANARVVQTADGQAGVTVQFGFE
jgi:minor curlin subunit